MDGGRRTKESRTPDMAMQIDMTGKIAIITGGGKGIGRTLTTRFLEAGAEVVICGRSESLESLPSGGGRTATYVQADIREPDQIQRVVDATVAAHGRIDILVNNAGGSGAVDTATVSPRFHAGIINLNLTAALNMSCAVYRVMREQEGEGNILYISSVAADRAAPGTAAYGAAKAGLETLARSLALEWSPKVRINSVRAGLIVTDQSALHYGPDGGAAVGATIPMGRMGTPDDIADTLLLLCSPYASWVTGAVWEVHGGHQAPSYLLVLKQLEDQTR
jgi:NAD(P)-dependent dehydrogenase (short-subunit alcohol dehydrogenase family)